MGDDKGMMKALALATQLGFAVAGPLLIFIAGGVWLDGALGTAPWLFFLGLALGIVSAGAALYQIATAQPVGKSRVSAKQTRDGNANDKAEDQAKEVDDA